VTAETLPGVNNELQACDKHFRIRVIARIGPGVRCRFGHGQDQARDLRQGFRHHGQDQGEAGEEHLASVGHIKVDTDKNGVVWMTGTAIVGMK
jgi:hypothetical protein